MKCNVAIFPAGTEIGLEINRALRYSTHIELFGFTSMNDHSNFVYKNLISGIPFYKEEDFLEKFNEKLEENNIGYVYPAHDDVQLYLTRNMEKISAKVVTSNLFTVEVCRSKSKTYEFFETEEFIPKFYLKSESNFDYPIFVKPDVGQGSIGAKLIGNSEQLSHYIKSNSNNMIICEYLPGEEYTIDCFTDRDGKLQVVKQRVRRRIKTGISVNSEILDLDKRVRKIALKINAKLKFTGAWFFQLKKDINNEYKLLEIAPRISGTMGLSRNSGINYPLSSVFLNMGFDLNLIDNNIKLEVDRAFINRYKSDLDYEYIYVDLDDTLILTNKVNAYLIMFLYQSIDNGKKIILITKHAKDVQTTLTKYRISEKLFLKIIHIKKEQEKSDYIEYENSIFIDDSFSERYAVHKNKGIPTFDCSEIEGLLDWREL